MFLLVLTGEHHETASGSASYHDQPGLSLAPALCPCLCVSCPCGGHSHGPRGACLYLDTLGLYRGNPDPYLDPYPCPGPSACLSPSRGRGGCPARAPLPGDGAWSATGSLRESYDMTYVVCSLGKVSVNTLPWCFSGVVLGCRVTRLDAMMVVVGLVWV